MTTLLEAWYDYHRSNEGWAPIGDDGAEFVAAHVAEVLSSPETCDQVAEALVWEDGPMWREKVAERAIAAVAVALGVPR